MPRIKICIMCQNREASKGDEFCGECLAHHDDEQLAMCKNWHRREQDRIRRAEQRLSKFKPETPGA